MTFTVYILKSLKDNRYYIGQTGNISQRFEMHNQGFVTSTKYRRPLQLIYTENFNTRSSAIKREKFLKKQKGGNVFKKIINIYDAG